MNASSIAKCTYNKDKLGVTISSVVDPHYFDADPDSTYHPDVDLDPNFHPDADPDPDPSLLKTAQTFAKVLK
jgi:hypothetical protein